MFYEVLAEVFHFFAQPEVGDLAGPPTPPQRGGGNAQQLGGHPFVVAAARVYLVCLRNRIGHSLLLSR